MNVLIVVAFKRLKEEFEALIAFINHNKESDSDWFRLESNSDGTKWFGKCWHYHNMLRWVFRILSVIWNFLHLPDLTFYFRICQVKACNLPLGVENSVILCELIA